MSRRIKLVVAIAAMLALTAASLAGAAKQKPKNGGFETGDFSRWTVNSFDSGPGDTWYVYSGTTLPQDTPMARPLRGGGAPTTFFAPPQGTFAAVTAGGAGTRILYRTLKLAKDKKHKLKMWLQYANRADEFFSPDTLDYDTGEPNQQYRVDLLRKNAPIDSLDGDDVVKEIFGTEPGDPLSMSPTRFKVNLTKYAGKRLLLRFAEVDNQFYFNAGVDGVKLKSKPKK